MHLQHTMLNEHENIAYQKRLDLILTYKYWLNLVYDSRNKNWRDQQANSFVVHIKTSLPQTLSVEQNEYT